MMTLRKFRVAAVICLLATGAACAQATRTDTRTGIAEQPAESAATAVVEQTSSTAAPALYLDATAAINDRVEDLLGRMTQAEKIGQMTLVEKNSIDREDIAPLGIGGLLSGGGGYPEPNTAQAWLAMVNDFQSVASESRLGIPLLYGVDSVHGHATVEGATIFPHSIGLGATGDADLVRQVARATALETSATGIRWNFAPVVAVPQDIRWGRTYESFSDHTELVAELGWAYVQGLQDASDGLGLASPAAVLATPKHFIGDGGTAWESSTQEIIVPYSLDQGDARMDEATLRALFLPPYEQALAAGAGSVMASFNSWNGAKVHGIESLLTGVLKNELGFDGFIVSDWGGTEQVDKDYYKAVVTAVNAGIDMDMVPYDYKRFIATLTEAVENGDVAQERIDDAVRRILRVKFAMGLFDLPLAEPDGLNVVGSAGHRALAREAVARSLVLLQNENDALPIDPDTALIHVAGIGADDVGIQSGGWTIEWQGRHGPIKGGTTILAGIEAAAGPASRVRYNSAGNFRETAGVGVVVLGELPYAEGVGDRANLELAPGDVDLLAKMRATSERLVVVLLSGRPLIITEQLPLADAWVAAWLPGSEGAGVSDALFGDVPFTGTLSVHWPRSMDQVPLSKLLADEAGPLFARGFGLTTAVP